MPVASYVHSLASYVAQDGAIWKPTEQYVWRVPLEVPVILKPVVEDAPFFPNRSWEFVVWVRYMTNGKDRPVGIGQVVVTVILS